MELTVCVATFGDAHWAELARTRAMPSAAEQGVRVVHRHGRTLAEARNECLRLVHTEWVCHLDADDELEPGYVEAMARGSADLRAPAVTYVRPNGQGTAPYIPKVAGHRHDCEAECLREGNWLVIGTAVRTELLRRAGGWWEEPAYEDWSTWLRCWLAGGTIEAVPEAVYRAYVRPDSRNRGLSMDFKNRVHHQIIDSIFPPDAAAAA